MAYCSVEDCGKEVHARGWCGTHYTRWRKYGDPHHRERMRGENPSIRFWSKVAQGPDCWEWQAGTMGRGTHRYGNFHVGRHAFAAHRFAWEDTHGTIPDGLQVLHRCDNTLCVRPDHLFLGTQIDNIEDMVQKKRQRGAPGKRNARYTHPENTARGERSAHAKLSDQDIRKIRRRYSNGESQETIARDYSVVQTTISRIIQRKSWSHID